MISFVGHVTLFLQFRPIRTFTQALLDAIFSSASGLFVGLQDLGSTYSTFGSPRDVALQDIRIECFFPSDATTQRLCEAL